MNILESWLPHISLYVCIHRCNDILAAVHIFRKGLPSLILFHESTDATHLHWTHMLFLEDINYDRSHPFTQRGLGSLSDCVLSNMKRITYCLIMYPCWHSNLSVANPSFSLAVIIAVTSIPNALNHSLLAYLLTYLIELFSAQTLPLSLPHLFPQCRHGHGCHLLLPSSMVHGFGIWNKWQY